MTSEKKVQGKTGVVTLLFLFDVFMKNTSFCSFRVWYRVAVFNVLMVFAVYFIFSSMAKP